MTARLPALTAASTRLYLDVGPAAANRSQVQPWQDMAWYYRDHLPEANYAVRFIGNCLSRIRLYPAIQLNPDEPLSSLRNDDGTPADGVDERLVAAAEHSLRRLRNGEEGQAGILRKLGEIQAVSGEPLLVGRHLGTGDEDWAVYSESEVVHKDGKWRLKERPDDRDGTPLDIGTPEKPGADFVLRIWTKHARWSGLADSPMRGVLDICEELTLWGKAMRATAMSRLSNGVFIIDEAITFPGPREPVVDGEFDEGAGGPDADDDSFEREMLDHFTTPIADQGSASAVVPFIKRVQPPDGRTVKDCVAWLQSERPIDRDIVARIEHLRTRFAAGVDLPTEILTGMGDMNHWSAWQVEESTYKVHIEPKLVALTNPLSAGYLHWDLLSQGFTAEEVQPIVVGYDPSDLVVRPNRGENALQAYDRFELSGDGLRTYLAIPDQYKPDQEEVDERLRRAGIGTTGDTSDQPIPANNPQITGGEPREKPDAATHRLRPLTASSVRPLGERLADIDRRLLSRLHVACDDAVNDAVRKAGSKLRAKAQGFTDARSQLRNVAAADVGRVLTADWVQGVGVTDDELFGDSFDALGDRYDTWVGSAQAQARRAAGVDNDELAASQEEDRKAGWGLLAGLLSTLAASLLYGTPPPVEGEQAAGLTVPAGYVRQGLARAGGVTDPQGRPSGTNPGATTGVATGPTVATALATMGQVVDGWTWDYGDPGDRAHPFEPHEALDGLSFTGWDDEVLDSTDSPFGPAFPSDHEGCLCQAVPNIVAASGDEGEVDAEAA